MAVLNIIILLLVEMEKRNELVKKFIYTIRKKGGSNLINKHAIGKNNREIWGKIVKDVGKAYLLNTGRIVKKETYGEKWEVSNNNNKNSTNWRPKCWENNFF